MKKTKEQARHTNIQVPDSNLQLFKADPVIILVPTKLLRQQVHIHCISVLWGHRGGFRALEIWKCM